mmetsp:Transcript_27314/g.70885  ORF Transcript_27314/g.70885 Transcript_27314/m.70885 type:complete len:207 (-) Transcript_27314:83-703(-)
MTPWSRCCTAFGDGSVAVRAAMFVCASIFFVLLRLRAFSNRLRTYTSTSVLVARLWWAPLDLSSFVTVLANLSAGCSCGSTLASTTSSAGLYFSLTPHPKTCFHLRPAIGEDAYTGFPSEGFAPRWPFMATAASSIPTPPPSSGTDAHVPIGCQYIDPRPCPLMGRNPRGGTTPRSHSPRWPVSNLQCLTTRRFARRCSSLQRFYL